MSSQLSHRKRNAEIDKLDGVGISLNMTSGDALQGVERGSASLPSSFGKDGEFWESGDRRVLEHLLRERVVIAGGLCSRRREEYVEACVQYSTFVREYLV